MQSIVKTILDRFLGPYCDFQGDINVDMWSGKAVLRHVRIKPEVVESIGIPFDIKSGYIDRIGLVCDWRSGFNKPVEVELSHVYAVMSPRRDYSKLDLEKIRKDAMQARRNKKAAELKEWEDAQFDPEQGFVGKLGRRLLRIEPKSRKQVAQESAEYTSPENMTQLEKLIAKIMANLRIKVSNVHIRLESQNNAIGVKIREFSVQTTDELFKPLFVKEIQNTLFKAITLEQLSIYLHSGPSIRSTLETQNLAKDEAPASEPQFRYVLRTELEDAHTDFLINPVSFTVHVTMQQQRTEKVPKMKIDAYLDEVKMAFKSTQYRAILRVNESISKSSETLNQLIGPEIYAEGNAESNLIDVDREYFDLYRRTLQVPGMNLPSLSKDEEGRLSTLELSHTAEEIKFYRKSVLNELDEYLVRRSGQMKYEIIRKRDVRPQGGFSSMLSWFKSSKAGQYEYAGLLPTDSEIDTVLETPMVEEDEEKALSTIFSEMSFKIPEISLTLIGDKGALLHGAIVGSEFKATAVNVSTINLEMTVLKISLSNLFCREAAFPELLYSSASDTSTFAGSPLLHLLIRVNPADLPAKFAVFGGIEPIDIVVDYVLIQNVLPFFAHDPNSSAELQLPEQADDSLSIISSLTAASPKDMALLRRPSIIVDLKISAPTILVPQRPLEKDTLLLVIDLGCFFVSTRPASGSTSDVDFSVIDASDMKDVDNPLYRRFYDNFTLEYKNLQIFLSHHGRNWRTFYDPESTESKLLCPVSSSLFLGLCVVVESGPLATLVVNIHFKPFTVQMSPNDLKEIMIISTGLQAISQTEVPSSEESQSAATRAKLSSAAVSTDQSIPADLTLMLSGKETDVDAFINVFLEKLHLAISVDSKTIINAVIDGVAVDLTRRTFDTVASFSIHDMYAEECLSHTKLIQSYLPTALIAPEDSDSRHFIYCRYVQTDRSSPNFREVDHLMEVSAGLLELNLEPTSLYETALFIKTLLDAVNLPPDVVESVQSAFDKDYLTTSVISAKPRADSQATVFSVHSKLDGVMLRVMILKTPILEASIRRIFCDVTKDARGCIKNSVNLDSVRIEDCLAPLDSIFKHILVSAEELPQLLVLDVEYYQERLDVDCKLDGMTLLFRTSLVQELLDLMQFSPISRISSVFAQASPEEVRERAASELSETAESAKEVKPGRINLHLGQLQLQLAADDKVDKLFTLSVKKASAQTQRSEIIVDVHELQALVSNSDSAPLANIVSISCFNVVYDVALPELQIEPNSFSVKLNSSPMSLLAGTNEYVALLDLYNSFIEMKPVIIRNAYGIAESPISLPPLQKSIAAVLPAMCLTVDRICSYMSKSNIGMDMSLKFSGKIQASLQSATGKQDAITLCSGFSFAMDMKDTDTWNIVTSLDALHVGRQANDITMNILRPIDLSLNVQSAQLPDSNRYLNVVVDADHLHLALSYSSILLCRNSGMILLQAFNPVLDSLNRKNTDDVESGDLFHVPAKIDIPVSMDKKEAVVAWNLAETFNLSLKSIRIEIANDIISSISARRLPVLEVLIVMDPKSEGHGYGNVRHLYLGLLLSAKIYNSKVSAWEPFLEPTTFTITSRQTISVQELNIAISEKLDINISDRMLASFMDSYKSFLAALTAPTTVCAPESLSVVNRESVEGGYTIQVKNDLEIPIKIFFEVGAQTHEVDIDRFSTNALPVFDESVKLRLSVGDDWLPIKDISIERVGAHSFWVIGSKIANKNNSVRVISEISDTGSSKMLLIHSDRQVQNHSPLTIDVAGFEVNPGHSLWLPAFTHDPSSILYISVPGSNSKSSLDFSKETSWLTFNIQEKGRLVCLQAERRKELCGSLAILLKPARLVLNFLPISCSFLCTARNHSWRDETPLVCSGNHHGLTMEPNQEFLFQFMLPFMESWCTPVLLNGDSMQTVTVQDRNANKLSVNVEVQSDKIIVFVGYWVYDLVQLPHNVQLQISSDKLESVPCVFPEAEFTSESGHLESLVEPLMFHSESGRAYLKLSLTNAQWSPSFSVQAAGSSEVVTVIAGTEAYQFNVNTSLCMAPFTRTKKIVFTPRYIIVNSLHFPIFYKQDGSSLECRLDSEESSPLYRWSRFDLPEKLCFKQDDPFAFWTRPISVSDVTDETLALQGRSWLRLARFEVQRGSSTFLLLSHQKPSLVPLVILNRTVCCDAWVRQKGHVTWRHLAPETGYPFGSGERSTGDYISLKFGRMTTSGTEIVKRIDLDLSTLKEKEFVLSWNDSTAHNIVIELEERGPFQSVVISERLLSRDAICSLVSSVHASINDLVLQWTAKKVELTELVVDSNCFLKLDIIECSHLEVPSESQAVYLSASAFMQTVQTPAVADITDPYFGTKHVFAFDRSTPGGSITFCVYVITTNDISNLFGEFHIPIELSTSSGDEWFNLEIQGRSIGQIHVSMRAFESKNELLKYEMQGVNAAMLKQQDIARKLDALMESAPTVIQMQSEIVADPNQKSELIEYQLLPLEIRGRDVPPAEHQLEEFSSIVDFDTDIKTASLRRSTRMLPSSQRLICDFKANVAGPDGGSHSAVVLTDWNGDQVARVLKEFFSLRVLSNHNYPVDVSVEICLKQEQRQRGKSAQYLVLDRVTLPLSQALNESWVKFGSGNNEICLTVIRTLIEVRQRDLFKPVSQIQLLCNQLGVSLIDRMSREIMYICILKTYLNLIDSTDQLGLQFCIGSLQSDNQMREALYPVVMFPKGAGNKDNKRIPWLQMALFNLKDKQNEGFANLPYFSLLLQETNFFVEEELVWALYEYANNMADILKPPEPTSERRLGMSVNEYHAHPPPGSAANIYIKSLILHPVALNITFQPDLIRREEKRLRLVSRFANPIDMLLGAAGVTIGSIKEAPIRIDSLEVFDVFGSWDSLFAPIKMHYLIQLLQQAYKLFGSLSVLGNPVGLVSNLGQGVKHLFYDPAQGLVSSPLDFGKGLASGSRRFVQHTVGGVLSSAGQITSSLSTGVAVLTMDRTYLEKREKDERKRIRAAAQGTESHNVATGLVAFGSGLIGGIRGAVEKPVAGLKRGGALGFLKGIVKGGAALIAQPIVGVIDLGTHTVQGIQGVIGKPTRLYGVSRCRLPRFITKSGVLDRYNTLSSKGQSVLWASGKLLGNISIPLTAQQRQQESLVSCKEIRIMQQPAGFRSIDFALTSFRIVAAEFDSDCSPPTAILFSIGYDQIESVSHSPEDDQFTLILTDGKEVPIKTRSPAEADEFLVWIIEHLEDCAPTIRHAIYGSGNCWITITDLLQIHVASLGRIPIVTADQIQDMIRQRNRDIIASCVAGRLFVEYTRGPDMITAEFDLTQPIAF